MFVIKYIVDTKNGLGDVAPASLIGIIVMPPARERLIMPTIKGLKNLKKTHCSIVTRFL
jgi:hypothetical protein